MIRKTYYPTLIVIACCLLVSCGSPKKITYFQDAVAVFERTNPNDMAHYDLRLKPNDNLLITVSSRNPVAAEPFNTISFERGSTATTSTLEWRGYLVDEQGYINFPSLGRIYVEGMTKEQLISYLEGQIKAYFDDPVVNIRMMNYKVTVMGEVSRPGVYTVTDEKITIPQALALAGDLTIYGRRDDVLLCRVEEGKKEFKEIDLKDPLIFTSPYYYLQQNDIIYVAPNKAQASRSEFNQTWSTIISISSLLVTIATFIYTVTKK
jgi:Periplasmic protein involved in polysaccharide export